MFDFESFFNERKLKYYIKTANKAKIIEYLKKCPNIKEAIKLLDTKYLHELDLEIYELPVEGYMNLYDYLIQTRNTIIHPLDENYKSRSIYLPILLKFESATQFIQYIDNDMLLDKMPNNQTVLEFLLENDYFFISTSGISIDNIEVAKILLKGKHYNFLANSSLEVLMTEVENNKTVLDVLKENNILPRIKYIKKPGLSDVDMCLKPKQNIALERTNNKYLLELLIEKGFDFEIELNDIIDNREEWIKIVRILLKKDQLKRIKDAPEEFLLHVINKEDNKDVRIIDILKPEELPNIVGYASNKDVLMRYIKAGKFDEIIYVIGEDGLVQELDNKYTILDFMLGKAVQMKRSAADIVQTLIMRRLITEKISVILSKYGVYLPSDYKKQTCIKSDTDLYSYIYENKDYEIDLEGKKHLMDFKLHFSEKENSPEVIETVTNSFKRTYTIDKELAIRDLKALILFKKRYPKFTLVYNPSVGNSFTKPVGYSFYENTPKITLKNKYNLESFHHELGHLVSFILKGDNTPEQIKEILDKSNETSLDRITDVFKEVNQEAEEQLLSEEEYEKQFNEFIISKYKTFENYKNIIREDFKKYIGSKELILEAVNDGSYSEEVLKAIVDSYFEMKENNIDKEVLLEMYVETRINAERKIFKDELYRKTNMEFLCYENFIDAFFGGELFEYFKVIPEEERSKIKAPICTHDKMYFIMQENGQFNEMYANYIELKKSPKGNFYIGKLKEKTDPRIIELLEEYDKYLTIALQSQKKDRFK